MGVLIGRSPRQKQSWMSTSAFREGSLNLTPGKGGVWVGAERGVSRASSGDNMYQCRSDTPDTDFGVSAIWGDGGNRALR